MKIVYRRTEKIFGYIKYVLLTQYVSKGYKNLAFATALFGMICLHSSQNTIKAQYNTNFINYSKTGRSVSLNVDFEAGSSGMSSRLVNKLVWGGFISEELKKNSSRKLKDKNVFGINLNYDVSAFIKGGKKYDLLIGFKNQEVINATYSRDFFNIMFYGNKMYKGTTADFSNCNVNALRFQEVKFGAIMHHLDSLGKIGVSLSFLKGEQLFHIQTFNNSGLYTSADGSEIVLNSNFKMAISDTVNRKLSSFNGLGASADIFFETPYVSKNGKECMLTVNANNIGFIHWTNNSHQYSSDSVLNFKGYQIKNIFDLKDSTLQRINRDSLLRSLSNARSEDFNVNIPTNLVIINKIYFLKNIFALGTGFRYIFNANYKPYLFIEPEYKFKNFTLAIHSGYGGYVRLNIGASVTYSGDKWFFRLGSNSLQGFIVPKSAFGQAVFLSTAYKLK
jgi:hypothetical protein